MSAFTCSLLAKDNQPYNLSHLTQKALVVTHCELTIHLLDSLKAHTNRNKQSRSEYMEKGELIPDDIVIRLVQERTSTGIAHERGFVLDGFPRNVHQAEMLDDLLTPESLDAVVDLRVPTNLVLKRIASRRVCADCGTTYSTAKPPRVDWICDNCGGEVVQRDDDTEAAIQRRLDLYEKETKPLIAFYREHGKLIEISGVGQEEIVSRRLIMAIDKILRQKTTRISADGDNK